MDKKIDFQKKLIKKFSVEFNGTLLLNPFVISERNELLYFHIAKTGGSTIHTILKDNKMDDGFLVRSNKDNQKKINYFSRIVEKWNSFFKFTFVRNKYSLLYALWNYNGCPCNTFEAFVFDKVVPSKYQYGLWIDQYYLTFLEGEPLFDFIGCQENFEEDLKKVMGKIGCRYDNNLRLNSAKYNHKIPTRNHYTNKMIDAIYSKFEDEINYFGFTL